MCFLKRHPKVSFCHIRKSKALKLWLHILYHRPANPISLGGWLEEKMRGHLPPSKLTRLVSGWRVLKGEDWDADDIAKLCLRCLFSSRAVNVQNCKQRPQRTLLSPTLAAVECPSSFLPHPHLHLLLTSLILRQVPDNMSQGCLRQTHRCSEILTWLALFRVLQILPWTWKREPSTLRERSFPWSRQAVQGEWMKQWARDDVSVEHVMMSAMRKGQGSAREEAIHEQGVWREAAL